MPLKSYGVLRGRAVAKVREGGTDSPHYQVHMVADGTDHRIAVNVLSQLAPSELLYLAVEDFRHPLLDALPDVDGWTPLPSGPGGASLDFVRGNMFAPTDMRELPPDLTGPDNDLSDRLDHFVERAIGDPEALLYAFGERWGPERGKRDKVFGFEPGNGVHDIHMNQGNSGRFAGDNGVWQDGGLLIHFTRSSSWVAIFLAFQSQAWHTDDVTGHPITDPGRQIEGDGRVRIVGALVNPVGPAPEAEIVTLLNTTPAAIDLTGWTFLDRRQNRCPTPTGSLAAGATIACTLTPPVALGNSGGTLTLLDPGELKVDGIAYTGADIRGEGWTVVF
ncbi:DUF2278 family protein [Nocardioides insulae]|uniref:DUF2278 family protein n=1 Tax=Nocardioides insulae TaxID=394734 RepID=UPI00048DAB50|nr:DUF2278 family protein [Nocardioides insulae]